MDKKEIEKQAKWLRRQVYEKRAIYWPEREPHPFEMVDPAIAARVLGIQYVEVEDLSFNVGAGSRYETAGIMDRPLNTIAIATRFGSEVKLFTGAHELGHWLLHPDERLHRDRPTKGLEREETDPKEREANYFAATFLMPSHFVEKPDC